MLRSVQQHRTDRRSSGKMAATAGYFGAFIVLGLAVAALGPTLPSLAANTRTSLGSISLLFTAHSLGYLLSAIFGGRLYDRLPGHPVLVVGLLVAAAMLALVPLIPELWLLFAILLVEGAAAGTLDIGGNTLLVWVHRERVGPFMNALHFFFGVGAVLSPIIIAGLVALSGGITWAYWALALLALPATLWLLPRPSPTAPATAEDEPTGGAKLVLVALIALLFFLYVGAELGFGGWVYTYALTLGLGTATSAAYLTSAYWGALTAGRLLAIPLAARVRPRWILAGSLVGGLLSIGLIMLWPQSTVVLWVGALGMGLFTGPVFATVMVLAGRHMTITGQITGGFLVGSSLGGMFLPWLIGQLFVPAGPQVLLIAVLVDLALALGALAAFLWQSERAATQASAQARGPATRGQVSKDRLR
jgi:FHS family Na+ dependent glucose MFS transporter 1